MDQKNTGPKMNSIFISINSEDLRVNRKFLKKQLEKLVQNGCFVFITINLDSNAKLASNLLSESRSLQRPSVFVTISLNNKLPVKNKKQTMCYNILNYGFCRRKGCPFKHKRPPKYKEKWCMCGWGAPHTTCQNNYHFWEN